MWKKSTCGRRKRKRRREDDVGGIRGENNQAFTRCFRRSDNCGAIATSSPAFTVRAPSVEVTSLPPEKNASRKRRRNRRCAS